MERQGGFEWSWGKGRIYFAKKNYVYIYCFIPACMCLGSSDASEPLELELQTVVSCHMMPVPEPVSSTRAVSALHH